MCKFEYVDLTENVIPLSSVFSGTKIGKIRDSVSAGILMAAILWVFIYKSNEVFGTDDASLHPKIIRQTIKMSIP